MKAPATPHAILLVRLGAVGDVIRTVPLLNALREHLPRTRLGWLVEEPSAPFLEALRDRGSLDDVHVLTRRGLALDVPRPWRWPAAVRRLAGLSRELQERKYDVVLDAHGTLKAAIASRLARTRTVGLAPPGSKEAASVLYDAAHAFPAEPMSRVRRAIFLGAAEGLLGDDPPTGADDDPATEFSLEFDPTRTLEVRKYARGRRPLVVLFPFASKGAGQRKRWPLPLHVDLARRLAADGCRVVVAWGSRREREEAASALPAADLVNIELAPPTDLVELAELLRAADLLVTGDTGPMHLAAAVGTRVLALFGPSDAIVNRPWGVGHHVLVREPLSDLAPSHVHAAAREMLAQPRSRQA